MNVSRHQEWDHSKVLDAIKASQDKNNQDFFGVSKVSDDLAMEVEKKCGHKIHGYDIGMCSDNIRHNKKRHPKDVSDDFLKMADMLSNGKILPGISKNDLPAVTFDYGKYILVMSVLNKKKRFCHKTLYKKEGVKD